MWKILIALTLMVGGCKTPQGIVLSDVKPGSLLSKHGFYDGDVILEINGLSIHNVQEAMDILSSLKYAETIYIRYLPFDSEDDVSRVMIVR